MSTVETYPNYEMLLTSVGPTTEVTQECLLEMGKRVTKLAALNVLVVSDGWAPYRREDKVSILEQLQHKAESMGTKLWTEGYIKYVLGDVATNTWTLGKLSETEGADAIDASEMLVIPGR